MLFYYSGEKRISSQTSPILSEDIQSLSILLVLTLEITLTFLSTDRTQPVPNCGSFYPIGGHLLKLNLSLP